MRKLVALVMAAMAAGAALAAQTLYFDFGGTGGRGTATVTGAPASNGKYWNNITPATEGATSIAANTTFADLIDGDGNPSAVSLTLSNAWGVNGNSSGGGLANPSEELLGDLAVESATIDYMFNTNNTDNNRAFVLRGLDPSKGYRFTIFGTRSAGDVREGRYTISGGTSWSTLMRAAGAGIGHNGENQNTDNAPVSPVLYPDANGTMLLLITHDVTTYIPLSCMKVETVDEAPEAVNVGRTLLLDFGSNGSNTARGNVTSGNWNNITNNNGNYCDAGTQFGDFIDTTGAEFSGLTLTTAHRFTTNGGSGGGGLASPSAALLGDLAVATATNDYFFTETGETGRQMTFAGLDPTKSYRFSLFGTRSNAENRIGLFQLTGLTEWYGAHQVAGNAYSGAASQNTAGILLSDPIFPAADGSVVLTVWNYGKTYVALSVMRIEEISGQVRPDIRSYKSVTLAGENVPEGEVTALTSVDRANWQVWTRLQAGTATLTALDEFDETKQILVEVPADGIYRIDVDLDTDTATLFEVTYFCVEGSAVGGWNTTGLPMEYIGAGCWHFNGVLDGYDKSTDSGRVNFIMNKSWSYTYKRVAGSPSRLVMSDGEDIPLNPGRYDITVDLNRMEWTIANGNEQLDPYRITMFGSSVCNGQGAAQVDGYNQGYANSYHNHLADRYAGELSPNPFYVSNISIGGNSSVHLLNRYDDLQRDYGRYVVFGISLGNEGIHGAADQEAIYTRFLTNMQQLIAMARAEGKVPVVMNNYTRADFTPTDYEYIKRMNAEIAGWDVPSVNMLGAIDNGAGQWADEYWEGDIYHPNTAGHDEFFYAMVPSMFDALHSGKSLTMNRTFTEQPYTFRSAEHQVQLRPEGTTHSFTLALSANMTADGILAYVLDAEGNFYSIERHEGVWSLVYNNASTPAATVAPKMSRAAALSNISLSHNYAQGTMVLTVDGQASSPVATRFAPVEAAIGHSVEGVDNTYTIGELMFYRSSMHTADPFASQALNKSSLEIYSPMSADLTSEVPNQAMSTNAARIADFAVTGVAGVKAEAAPVEVRSGKGVLSFRAQEPTPLTIVSAAGAVVAHVTATPAEATMPLLPGLYVVNGAKALVR